MPELQQRQRDLQVQTDERGVPTSASAGDTSPYRRDPWWGRGDDVELDLETLEKRGTPKALHVAKTVLRREATVLCPHCLHDRDRAVEISDPQEHVPRTVVLERDGGKNVVVELAVLPKAHRWCPDCGSISFGGPLADRTQEEFKAIIDEVTGSVEFTDFPASRLEKARSDALAKKGREEGPHDVRIMREFVEELLEA